jgi:hypothetical protein
MCIDHQATTFLFSLLRIEMQKSHDIRFGLFGMKRVRKQRRTERPAAFSAIGRSEQFNSERRGKERQES